MYKTTDLPLASYLFYRKFKITKIEKTPYRKYDRATFCFAPKQRLGIEDVVRAYYNGECLVEPIRYEHARSVPKNMIRNLP